MFFPFRISCETFFAFLICFNRTFMFLLFQLSILLHLLLINQYRIVIAIKSALQYNKPISHTYVCIDNQTTTIQNCTTRPPTNPRPRPHRPVHTRHVPMIEFILNESNKDLSPEALEREERGEAKGTFTFLSRNRKRERNSPFPHRTFVHTIYRRGFPRCS